MEKTVLITGGCGFIGTNLCLQLLQTTDYKIILVDNFITSSKKSIIQFENNKRVDIIINDICEIDCMLKIKNKYSKIHKIFHLASLASPKYYKRNPIETLDVGYIGTKNILDLCVHYTKIGCKTCLLYTSTSEVYGDPKEHPQKETYYGNVNSYGPRSCYDSSKRIGEALFYTYNELYNLNTRIVRIFNTYGPYMSVRDGRIITEIIRAMILGTPLYIHGDGTQTRSLCYINDTVRMIINTTNAKYTKPINIGNNVEITINELITTCKKIYKNKFKKEPKMTIIYTNAEIDDPRLRQPDLTLNKKLLGDVKFISLEDGISSTLSYFINIIDDNI